jgi:hypothetical protein
MRSLVACATMVPARASAVSRRSALLRVVRVSLAAPSARMAAAIRRTWAANRATSASTASRRPLSPGVWVRYSCSIAAPSVSLIGVRAAGGSVDAVRVPLARFFSRRPRRP